MKLESPENNSQKELEKIIEGESTNLQWKKLGLSWGLMIIMTVVSILRGSSKETSLLESERCDVIDWSLFIALMLTCVFFFLVGILIIAKEYQRKVKCGYVFSTGDL